MRPGTPPRRTARTSTAASPCRYVVCSPTTGPANSRSASPRVPSRRMPAKFLQGVRCYEARHLVDCAAAPVRPRTTRVEQWRVEREGSEEHVDRLGAMRVDGAGIRVLRRPGQQASRHRAERLQFTGGKESRSGVRSGDQLESLIPAVAGDGDDQPGEPRRDRNWRLSTQPPSPMSRHGSAETSAEELPRPRRFPAAGARLVRDRCACRS